MARLVTIGDSISQGFMSGGAARTDLCFSRFMADALNIRTGRNYRFADWPLGGLPLNFEVLFRHLAKFYGGDIWGPFEWTSAAVRISDFIDKLEGYYERGDGDYRRPHPSGGAGFHNLASFGFTISDAWEVTPRLALEKLEPDGVRPVDDEWFATPSDAYYRSAFRVLNPANRADRLDYSQLSWVEHYAENDRDGVENLVVWLGANNCLGTVLDLDVREITAPLDLYREMEHFDKDDYNLWTEDLFAHDYRRLLTEITRILGDAAHTAKQADWRVFVANVPAITIAPLAKGVGRSFPRPDPFGVLGSGARYFEHYVYFIFDTDAARSGDVPSLSADDAYRIDERIARYNEIIDGLIAEQNAALGREHFHMVDVNRALLQLAFKRNNGRPTYELPDALKADGRNLINTKYYHAENTRVTAGGVFSLDGVHPSVIGQALLAHEFLQVMEAAGRRVRLLPWNTIMRLDSLFSRPLNLIQEVYQHDRLARLLVRIMRSPGPSMD